MSTKTMKQRIALVAVSALTAGVLSVVSAPAANAAASSPASGATNIALANDLLKVAIKTGTAAIGNPTANIANNVSNGLEAYDDSVGTTATATATMDESGALALYAGAPTTAHMIVVSGGVLSDGVGVGGTTTVTRNTAGTPALSAANVALYSAASTNLAAKWTPGIPGTFTVKYYTGAVSASFASLTAGTLVTTITVTVRATSGLNQSANGVSGTIGLVAAASDDYSRAQTVSITSDGSLAFTTRATGTADQAILTVSGGTINTVVSGTPDFGPSADRTSIIFGDAAVVLLVKPNAGATSMIIKSYSSTANYSAGTVSDKITVTVVASTTIGVLSASKSLTNWVPSSATIANDADTDLTNIDVAGANIIANGGVGYIGYSLNDANGVDLPATGVISVVSSNPLIAVSFDAVFFNTEIAKAVGASNFGMIYVAQAVANTPASGTITIKYNGTAYTTKSVTMQGDIASIVVSDIYSGKTGVSGTIATEGGAVDATTTAVLANAGSFSVVAKDAAGNVLGGKTVSADTTRYNNVVSAITLANSGATIKFSASTGLTAGPGTGSLVGTFSCPTSTEGTGGTKQRLKITSAALATIYSNEFDATCGGSPDSYTASLDKASYVPGDIATLTITAKTSTGKAPYSAATTGTATSAVGITQGSQMTPVTAIAVTDTFGNTGVKTYKFVVGATEGSYNMIVDLPKWSVANGYSGAAQTAKYTVASGTATVSNAQVLQSIVALIASINKQIQALQKLILARR